MILAGLLATSFSQDLKFMTYNIRFDNPADGADRWDARKSFLADQVKFYSPDVMGTQEGLLHQLDYLDSCLLSYAYTGVGRDDGKQKGEFTAIFYNKENLELIESTSFWLSETPEKVSVGWDAALPRICTYALFSVKASGMQFYVFNTHFDHIGEQARINSTDLIIEKVKAINMKGFPVVVMGDFNLEPGSEAIRKMSAFLPDSRFSATEVAFGPGGTFNAFDFSSPVTRRIDYIFTDPSKFKVLKYAVLSDSKDLHYPSDHLPVFVEVIHPTRAKKKARSKKLPGSL